MKASKAEVARRVDEVCCLRLEGARRQDVLRYAAEKEWGLQLRQVEEYIRRADALLIAERGRKLSHMVALHLARREELYRRALKKEQYQVALSILDSGAKLADLFPKDDFKEVMKQIVACEKKVAELEPRLKGYQAKIAELEAELARRDRQAASALIPPTTRQPGPPQTPVPPTTQ